MYDTGIRNILQVYVTGIRSRLQVYYTGTSSRLQVYDTGNNSRLTVRCTIQVPTVHHRSAVCTEMHVRPGIDVCRQLALSTDRGHIVCIVLYQGHCLFMKVTPRLLPVYGGHIKDTASLWRSDHYNCQFMEIRSLHLPVYGDHTKDASCL